jgi:sRNA-binding carbon storage regulator CsrA
VKFSVDAPPHIKIMREEIADRDRPEPQETAPE